MFGLLHRNLPSKDNRFGIEGPSDPFVEVYFKNSREGEATKLMATTAISATQIQPMVRCGSVPLGAVNWTSPSTKAAIAANACSGICGAASSNGAKVTTRLTETNRIGL